MKVLYIGGTGTISASCARRAIDAGIDLSLFNRGTRGFTGLLGNPAAIGETVHISSDEALTGEEGAASFTLPFSGSRR